MSLPRSGIMRFTRLEFMQLKNVALDFDHNSALCRFKYILIKIEISKISNDSESVRSKYLVRGSTNAEFHNDILLDFTQREKIINKEGDLSNQNPGEEYEWYVLGGGRIAYELTHEGSGSLTVFGHSYGFPWDGCHMHSVTKELCISEFPRYIVDYREGGY